MDLASAFMQYVQRCPHVMQSIQGFVGENCHHFADLAVCEEHRLEYTTIHQQFLALLEQHVEAFLQFQGASESEFLEALQSVQEAGEWKPFKSLLDKTDYHTFAKMMQIQG